MLLQAAGRSNEKGVYIIPLHSVFSSAFNTTVRHPALARNRTELILSIHSSQSLQRDVSLHVQLFIMKQTNTNPECVSVGSPLRNTRIVLQHQNTSSLNTFPSPALIWEKKDILHQSTSIWEVQPRRGEFVQSVDVQSVEIGVPYKRNEPRRIYVPLAIHDCHNGVEVGQTEC